MAPRQPIAKGLNKKGEIVWGSKPMASWQTEMMKIAVRAAAVMCPKRYAGDFLAFWQKVKLIQERDLEIDSLNASFSSFVPGHLEKKYKAKHNPHKGD